MNARTPSGTTEAWPIRAFQTDPSWYEDYWYGGEPSVTPRPTRHPFAEMPLLAAVIAWLYRLITEQPAEHTPVADSQDARCLQRPA